MSMSSSEFKLIRMSSKTSLVASFHSGAERSMKMLPASCAISAAWTTKKIVTAASAEVQAIMSCHPAWCDQTHTQVAFGTFGTCAAASPLHSAPAAANCICSTLLPVRCSHSKTHRSIPPADTSFESSGVKLTEVTCDECPPYPSGEDWNPACRAMTGQEKSLTLEKSSAVASTDSSFDRLLEWGQQELQTSTACDAESCTTQQYTSRKCTRS